ncbi:RNA-directed DNA polymerase, eukaryota, reverse transcriptase zinc-binding domain protein [Tanacetum coccineum]
MAIKGRLKTQDMISRWLNILDMKCPFCKDCKDSHSHLFFGCSIARRLWERLKGMAKLEHRLVLGAFVYYIWQERNMRLFEEVKRTGEEIFKLVVESVRLRIMGLKLKTTKDVIEASKKWCSMDRWPIWTVENSALKNLGPWKTGWCCSDLVFTLLSFLECPDLVDCSSGFLSMGMVMGLQDMRYFDWNEWPCLNEFVV